MPGRGPAGTLFAALDAGVALIAEHTNLDRAPEGVAALPSLLGLRPLEPVESALAAHDARLRLRARERCGALVDAMSAAGAGASARTSAARSPSRASASSRRCAGSSPCCRRGRRAGARGRASHRDGLPALRRRRGLGCRAFGSPVRGAAHRHRAMSPSRARRANGHALRARGAHDVLRSLWRLQRRRST